MNITLEQVKKWEKNTFLYLDLRGKIAYEHGHIDGALCFEQIKFLNDVLKNKRIIVYCTYGTKSLEIAEQLREQGYDAYNLVGGFREWLLQNDISFSKNELIRYDRQIILPQIGISGQKKIKQSKVLIVGAGGLGAPAALYLAGAGVGKIGIVDADTVSISNLQRQIIHDTDSVNKNKALSAKHKLELLNDTIECEAYSEFLVPENAEEIIGKYDFVIDAADNFETKFLINDVCVLQKKAFCHAGILGFQGQVLTYVPNNGPCYRCIFEEIPQSDDIPNCSQAGVIGAMAGIIGSIQALEAIKYIVGIGKLLTGRIYVLDGLTMQSRIVEIPKKNNSCRICGSKSNIKDIMKNQELYRMKPCKV